MNALTTLPLAGMPAAFASATGLPDMAANASANLQASFAVIGYKGRNWRLKYRGEEELLTDERNVPVPFLEVSIVGISPAISKIWYEKKYSEGDDASPDCWSTDGKAPEAASPKKQCATCAACPQNVFGSRITDAGKKGKACQDSRRLAVVPSGDVENEGYGGPMLLRLPPMSLANLDKYCRDLKRFGDHIQPYMVKTQVGFNYDVAYPEITFTALGWADPDDAATVLGWIDDPQTQRILAQDTIATETVPATVPDTVAALAGAPPPPAAQAAPAPAPVAQAAQPAPAPVAQAAQPAPAPVAQAAQPAPAAAPAPAPARRGFGKKTADAAAAAPAQAGIGGQAAPPVTAAPAATTVVQQAPANMEQAIDDLLN